MAPEAVRQALGGGYCQLPNPLKLAPAVRGTVAGHRLGALEGGGGYLPPFQCIPAPCPTQQSLLRMHFTRHSVGAVINGVHTPMNWNSSVQKRTHEVRPTARQGTGNPVSLGESPAAGPRGSIESGGESPSRGGGGGGPKGRAVDRQDCGIPRPSTVTRRRSPSVFGHAQCSWDRACGWRTVRRCRCNSE